MTKTAELLRRALELPRADRGRLVRELIVSLGDGEDEDPAEVQRAWTKEIDRRLADLESGRAKLIPGDKVMARLRAAQERDERRARGRKRRA